MLSSTGFARYCAKVRSAVWIMISAGIPGVGEKFWTRCISSGEMVTWDR